MKYLVLATSLLSLCFGCSIYTFSNSALPSHLKTIEIPLFQNGSLEPNIADEITQELNQQVTAKSQVKLANGKGDALITGRVIQFERIPYSYGATAAKEIDVDQYVIKITAEVEFLDNIKNNELFKGVVVGEGIYSYKTEEEKVGREKAVKDIVTRILEKSIQSW